jgi:hypothetical protein
MLKTLFKVKSDYKFCLDRFTGGLTKFFVVVLNSSMCVKMKTSRKNYKKCLSYWLQPVISVRASKAYQILIKLSVD